MIKLGRIEILAGALASEAAREERGGGVFTKRLVQELRDKPDLTKLPLNLFAWRELLPDDLLAEHKIEVLSNRDALGPEETSHGQRSQSVAAV